MAMWPSTREKMAGWPAVTASKSWRVGSCVPVQRVWSQPPPVSQVPGLALAAKARMRACMAASDLLPTRSTLRRWLPARARWV